MFRRTSKAEPVESTVSLEKGPGAKGRPTPSRRAAEAARRERAKAPVDKKASQRAMRERRNESTARLREGMRTGDERYLPARDKGPVKRFIRNFVDSRFTIVELLLPLLVVIMALQYSRQDTLVRFSNTLWTVTLLIVLIDTVWLMIRLKRALRAKFPDESLKGTTTYTLMRVIQVRFLRQPKPQVRIGGKPK